MRVPTEKAPMHKRRERSDKGTKRPERRRGLLRAKGNQSPAARGESRPATHPLLDRDGFEHAIRDLGEKGNLASAAMAIGCSHTTLSRLISGALKGPSHTLLLKILAAAERKDAADGNTKAIEQRVISTVLPPQAQLRLKRYFKLMDAALDKQSKAAWRGWFTVGPLERRYPGLFQKLYDGLHNQAVPARAIYRDLAMYRMLAPLFDGYATQWMEVGWRDFLTKDSRGRDHESLLRKFLSNAIENELILLRVRGPDQIRAIRLSIAAEACAAAVGFGESRSEEAEASRRRMKTVYLEQGIPASYIIGKVSDGDHDEDLCPEP